MASADTRPAAFAGRWYPASSSELQATVDGYLAAAAPPRGVITGIVAPHAGLAYSGPVAGHAYAAARAADADAAVLIGPSHYAAFSGAVVPASSAFETPLGPVPVETTLVAMLTDQQTVVQVDEAVHAREHSLELQLPFLARVLPGLPIVPILMGRQDARSVETLSRVVTDVLGDRRVLVIASSDLSHYHDRATAAALDRVVLDRLEAFDDGTRRTRAPAAWPCASSRPRPRSPGLQAHCASGAGR